MYFLSSEILIKCVLHLHARIAIKNIVGSMQLLGTLEIKVLDERLLKHFRENLYNLHVLP